jgi:hypothetical protein
MGSAHRKQGVKTTKAKHDKLINISYIQTRENAVCERGARNLTLRLQGVAGGVAGGLCTFMGGYKDYAWKFSIFAPKFR